MPDHRVFVSGCGAVSPYGVGVPVLWHNLLAGRSGIARIESFDTSDISVRIAGEVRDLDAEQYLDYKVARRSADFVKYALIAAQEAVAQAGLPASVEPKPGIGVVMGTGYGPETLIFETAKRLLDKGPRSVGPMYAAASGTEAAATEISLWLGSTGPNLSISTACATGATCVGEAFWMIRSGRVEAVVAGGTEDCINQLDLAAASRTGALSTHSGAPEEACRPFDLARTGFVMSAGAGVLVLESQEHLAARGGVPLAEIVGYSSTSDAFHITAPHPQGAGARRALVEALDMAEIDPGQVDYINAHGTGTLLNDRIEIEVLRSVFGTALTGIPISSTKSMIGHLIGAAGAVELIVCVAAMRAGCLPPTINCRNPEFGDLDFVTSGSRRASPRYVLSNSFGFGGHNSCVVLRDVETSEVEWP